MDKIKTDAQLTAEEEAKKAADEVIAIIDKIGNVAFDEATRDAINAAKEAYDALSEEAKALVGNIDVLESAQENYEEIVEKAPVVTKEDKKSGISASTKYLSTYDVHIDGGYEGNITLTFDVGSQYDGRNVAIKHLLDNGNIETYTVTVKDGKVTVTVDSLSPFVLALLEKVDIPSGNTGSDSDMTNNTSNTSVKTGDDSNLTDPIVLMLLAAACMFVLVFTRKKRDN